MKTVFRPILVPLALLLALMTALFTGCRTRSISDSGYGGRYGGKHNPFYRGELSEFDLLGIERGAPITDDQIAKALEAAGPIRVRQGSTLLLIQSGAYQPDEPMRAALNKLFHVIPFTGQPPSGAPATNAASYARAMRLAAAQAGCETIVCYWGSLESARTELGTKTVSWVPVVGMIVPDESQRMRIRLKVALVDVRSGRWTLFASPVFESKSLSEKLSRESSDQGQVEKLKRLAYDSVASGLAEVYGH